MIACLHETLDREDAKRPTLAAAYDDIVSERREQYEAQLHALMEGRMFERQGREPVPLIEVFHNEIIKTALFYAQKDAEIELS